MKGVILAGGSGTRLFPMTAGVNKHLLPIHDKPMIFYPLTTLISASIQDIVIVCNETDIDDYKALLGNGEQFGSVINYISQSKPDGIVSALNLASAFTDSDNMAVILGDNIFLDSGDIRRGVARFKEGVQIFGKQVSNPENYGVVEYNDEMRPVKLSEKPTHPLSSTAVTGFYIFDKKYSAYANNVKLSARGEYEIMDVLRQYLTAGTLELTLLSRGAGWIDAGTKESYAIVCRYIESIQQMHGVLIGSPHEAAFVRGFVSGSMLRAYIDHSGPSDYSNYLQTLLN